MKVVVLLMLASAVAYADPVRIGVLAEGGHEPCSCSASPTWAGGELALERSVLPGFMVGGAVDLQLFWDTNYLEQPIYGMQGDVVATAGGYSPDDEAVPWLHAFATAQLGIVVAHSFRSDIDSGVGYIPAVDVGVDLGSHAKRFRAQVVVAFPSTFDRLPRDIWVTIGVGIVFASRR